jgi:hypothetical protein
LGDDRLDALVFGEVEGCQVVGGEACIVLDGEGMGAVLFRPLGPTLAAGGRDGWRVVTDGLGRRFLAD